MTDRSARPDDELIWDGRPWIVAFTDDEHLLIAVTCDDKARVEVRTLDRMPGYRIVTKEAVLDDGPDGGGDRS